MSKMTVDKFVTKLLNQLESGKIQLPTLPEVALRVRDAVDDPDANAAQIAEVISEDAALSARLLQVANSALYGARDPIDRLPRAITRLGNDVVRDVVTAQAMKQMFQATNEEIDTRLRDVWAHSVEVAAVARAFAPQCPGVTPDQAMLAGLLHDIGALPILYFVEQNDKLLRTEGLLERLLAEVHTRIGGELLSAWEFPPALIAVAAEHENLQRKHEGGPDLVDLVQVANLQHRAGTNHPLGMIDWSDVPAFAQLGFDDDVQEIELTDIAEDIDEMKSLLM